MNSTQVFKTVVKLANDYRGRDKNDVIIESLAKNYQTIINFPTLDNGHYLVVQIPLDRLGEVVPQGQDHYDFFRGWLSENTHRRVVALFGEDYDHINFFFEDVSDATYFKLKWA